MEISPKNLLWFVLTIGSIASSSLPANATEIPVANSGFEGTFLANDGDFSSVVPDWSPYGNIAASSFGAWNPGTWAYTSEMPEGQNVLDLYDAPAFTGGSQVLQSAEGQFQADADYELTVKVGRNLSDPFAGYIIQLVVNNTIIAQDDNSQAPSPGTFAVSSLQYTYNADLHASLVGSPIEIRLLTKGLDGPLADVNFDDVQLTFESSNAQARPGGPYSVNTIFPLTLDGSASLPSTDGNSITAYEWDLNDNGETFTPDVMGATPAAISYSTLTSNYGMVLGENTIRLRVTDDTGKSAISSTTVTLNPLYTYIGPDANRGNIRWNNPSYWDSGIVPEGSVDVRLTDGTKGFCWSALTPTYTGNLYMGTNSLLNIGWTTQILASYNCLGTPGSSTIVMESGARISVRMGGQPVIPAIRLNGDAIFSLGTSTQPGASGQFNHGITGPYKFTIQGNRVNTCIANFNTPNSFSELEAASSSTIKGRAPGSLGTGNVTIGTNTLFIDAEDSMADSATLSIDAGGELRMNANDTIASLIYSGKQFPAGTYGSTASNANNQVDWITGDKVLTVTDSEISYWDANGSTAGAGGPSPSGTWDGSTKWTSSPTGTDETGSWISGSFASFSAGDDATGAYTVTVGAPSGITVTKQLPAVTGEITPVPNPLNESIPWALEGGNAVAIVISAINATDFTATYAGQPMTVIGVSDSLDAYSGIAYIIGDNLPETGNVVINMPYDNASGNTGGYARFGYAYSVLSLSGVASAGTPVSKVHTGRAPSETILEYATETNNAYVLGVSSDSNWQTTLKSVTGQSSEIIYQGKPPAYYNTLLCQGSIAATGTYSDIYGGQPTALITLPFEASSESNPLFTNQKITGLSFENGTVTLDDGELELQGNNPIIANATSTGIIKSQLSGVTGAGITKRGAGTVQIWSTANSYPGSTVISDGTLQFGASDVLPTGSPVLIGGNASGVTAVLDFNGYDQTIDSLTFNGATTTSGGSLNTGSGSLALGGEIVYNSSKNPLGATISGQVDLGSLDQDFAVQDSSTAQHDLTISAVISGSGGFTKSEFGTLVLSADNTYTGSTIVTGGLLSLTGNNNAATGDITVKNNAAISFNSPNAINGAGRNLLVESGGLVYFEPSFGSANIPAMLNNRINTSSTGAIAVDNYTSTDFDFGSLDMSLGALNNVTYTGTLTPNISGEYRIGGGSGAITIEGANTLSGTNSLNVNGRLIIANSYTLSGTTTITSSGRLQIGAGGAGLGAGSLPSSIINNNGTLVFNRSDTSTQGTDFKAPITGTGSLVQSGAGSLLLNAENTYSGGTNLVSGTLLLGHPAAIGTGPLTIYSGTLDVVGPNSLDLTSIDPADDNPIALSADFIFGGTADLNMGTGDINNYGSPTITLNGSGRTLTLGGVMTNSSGTNQNITVNGDGNTLVFGGYKMSNDLFATNLNLTIGGSANVTITGPVDDLSAGEFLENFGTLSKIGNGTLTLSGDNKYTGDTLVKGGILHLESGTQDSPIFVENGGTLGFTLGSTSNENTITSTQKLTFEDGSKVRILGAPDPNLLPYTLMTASSVAGVVPELDPAIEDYVIMFDGDSLILTVPGDIYPPGLIDILDDKNGGTIAPNTLVTYTVSFNEDIDETTVTLSDFDNAGTAEINIGMISETTDGNFTVQVTPTTTGTLQLRIPTTADIRDVAGNILESDPALLDDTVITVTDPYDAWANGIGFEADYNGDGIPNGLAWLFGASNPSEDARLYLPFEEEISGDLHLYFTTLNSAARGNASIKVQYSNRLDIAATWTNNEAEVPDTTSVVNGVNFIIQPISDKLINVEAIIPASGASADGSLFGRVFGSPTQ